MVAKKQLKVLYVCPFAHQTGHFPWEATHETRALSQAGIDVSLLTFCGVTDETEVKVPQLTACSQAKLGTTIYRLANFFRKWGITRWLSMFLETYLTLAVAIRLKQQPGYDIIHLRDGEPFLFLPHLLNLRRWDYNWVISLTGSNLVTLENYPSLISALRESFSLFLYTIYIRFLTSDMWRPIYLRSLARNRFLFLTQNETMQQDFESYMDGILKGKVLCLSLGVNDAGVIVSRERSRRRFGLPRNKPVFLSFGFLHGGKDMETIFKALKDIPDAFCLHGGDQMSKLHLSSCTELAKKYGMLERSIIRDYYIPEEEKPYYFFAADAIILSYTRRFTGTASLLWQACRFEIPVIASDNGQLKELVEEYQPGLLFKAQDSNSLRQAIMRFIELRPEEVRVLKDNCRRFAREFSHEKWAEKCLAIYDKLLAGRS
jgi:glycosyltransferase involved in cell wall biosynthesis